MVPAAVAISPIVRSPQPAGQGYSHDLNAFSTDAWMRCNTRWILDPAELAHLTEPCHSDLLEQLKSDDMDVTTVPLGLYLCFDSSTSRSTLLTFGLGLLHQRVCEQFNNQDAWEGTKRESINTSEDPFSLILAWCWGLMCVIEEIAALWYRHDEIYVSPIVQPLFFILHG